MSKIKIRKVCGCGMVHLEIPKGAKPQFAFDEITKTVDPFSGLYFDCLCGSTQFIPFSKLQLDRLSGDLTYESPGYKRVFAMIGIVLSLWMGGCASTKYGWMPADSKTEDQARAELAGCEKESLLVPNDKFGSLRDRYVTKCMYSQGHKIVELK